LQTVLESTKLELDEAKTKFTELNLSMQQTMAQKSHQPAPQQAPLPAVSTSSNPVPAASVSVEDLTTTTGVGILDTDMRYINRAQPPSGSSNSICAQCTNPIVGFVSLFHSSCFIPGLHLSYGI